MAKEIYRLQEPRQLQIKEICDGCQEATPPPLWEYLGHDPARKLQVSVDDLLNPANHLRCTKQCNGCRTLAKDIPDPEKSWEPGNTTFFKSCVWTKQTHCEGGFTFTWLIWLYYIICITKQVETCHSSHVSQSDDATLWLVEMTILTKRGTVWRLHPKGKGVIGFVASECSPQKKEYQNIWELRPSILWHLKYRKYKIAMHCGKI